MCTAVEDDGDVIKSSSDLLRELAQHERQKLDEFGVSHRPTIGDMYEGLSRDLLALSVPHGVDLQVVSGFVEDDDGKQSGQIDCMLVTGVGRKIPYTPDSIWNISDVIAVFEIKKTLHKTQLVDAFAHLNTVRDLERPDLLMERGADLRSVNRVFAQLTGSMPPQHLSDLSKGDRIFYNTLVREHHGPIRIVFGYHGYKTEKAFRNTLYEYLNDNLMTHGFGVSNFPQLMISGDYTLAKINGEPYVPALNGDREWTFYMSTALNPLMLVLEYVWTRLDRLFGLPDEVWGEDLENDILNAYLAGRPDVTDDGQPGWHYTYMSGAPAALVDVAATEPWEPTFLTDSQAVLIGLLCSGAEVKFDNEQLTQELAASGITDIEAYWASLLQTTLVARSVDRTGLVLMPKQCGLAVLPDGQWVAGENNTGRLARWVQKRLRVAADGSQ